MQIQILYKNKIDKNYIDVEKEYINRIKNYTDIKLVDKFDKNTNNTYFIKIDRKSKTISSVEFAQKISDILSSGCSKVFFTLQEDGSYEDSMTISNMQVSDDMQIILLLEQIYRSFKINNNETYHK